MRVPHILKANKGSEQPQSLCFVDTETTPHRISRDTIEHRLAFGWACYQRTIKGGQWAAPTWARFTRPERFWAWLESCLRPRTRTFVFAHNWAFDGPVLDVFGLPLSRGWVMERAIVDAPPWIVTLRRDSCTLTLLDTLNWWRCSLADLGDSLGIPKLKMPGRRASRRTWDRYCRRDVEVIRRAILEWLSFLRSNDLGGFAPTQASQAMRTYRHRFMDHPIFIDCDLRALALSRDAYHGGRCECFRLGKVAGPVHVLDVNSQYPAVMRRYEYPHKLIGWTDNVQLDDLPRWLKARCVVARCLVETDEPAYAHVHNGRLVFPVGRFTEALTTPDLAYALKRGHLKAVYEAAVYERAPLFVRFVDELYQHRLDAKARGDKVAVELFKKILNGFYGKWGQAGGKWTEHERTADLSVRVWDEFDYDTGTLRQWRQFGGLIQSRDPGGESRDSFPAIAAHVTAYARRDLWAFVLQAGRANLYYCDTDSLWVSSHGVQNVRGFVDPLTLGALKAEGVHKWAIFRGAKDYQVPGLSRTKGVRSTARWITSNVVEQERWSGIRGLMRTGRLTAPHTTTVRKHLKRDYQKGNVGAHGLITPLALDDTAHDPEPAGD